MLHPTDFDKLHFHFIKIYFKISLKISYLTHVLFTSVLFNLQVFGDFMAFCLLLISSLTPLLSESWCCMISFSFKFVKVCFMSQDVVYSGECSMWAWEKCIFCCCWMNLLINVSYMRLTKGTVDFNYVLTDFLPAGSIFDRGVRVSITLLDFSFSPYSSVFASCILMLCY